MAPACMELSCTKGGCQFVTPAMELALAMEYMQFHQTDEHSEEKEVATKPAQKDMILQSHAAPVHQVKDSEDDAMQREQVKAKKSVRRRNKTAVPTKVSEPIEVAKDISTTEVINPKA